MAYYACPHCNDDGISIIRKIFLGPVLPATCSKCGGKVGVPSKPFYALMIPLILILVIVPPFAILLLPIFCFIHLKWVPLIPK